MLHLLFTKVFDHYIFKQMQRMTFSGMLDFDRANDKLSTPYEYNLLFSATYPLLLTPNLLSRKTSNSNSKTNNLTTDIRAVLINR